MAELLKLHSGLLSLDFEGEPLDAAEVERLARALECHPALTELDLCRGAYEEGIGDSGAQALATALEVNDVLTSLNLRNNGIGEDGFVMLAEALEQNGTLQHLILCRNKPGKRGAQALAGALECNTTLRELDLSCCGLVGYEEKMHRQALRRKVLEDSLENESDEVREKTIPIEVEESSPEVEQLLAAVGRSSSLTNVSFRENTIGDRSIQEFCQSTRETTSIAELDLWRCGITAVGVSHLAAAFSTNSSLTSLNLMGNSIGPEGMSSLGVVLNNGKISNLNLSSCGLGDEGSEILAKSLRENDALCELHICRNSIGDDGLDHFSSALEANRRLTLMSIRDNRISDRSCKRFAEALKTNTSLVDLELCGNKIGDAGARALGMALTQNCTLHVLNLRANLISYIGVDSLAAGLERNHCLKELDLSKNEIYDNTAERLGTALGKNTAVRVINLEETCCGEATVEWITELAASIRHPEICISTRIAETDKIDLAFSLLQGDDDESEENSLNSEEESMSDDEAPSAQISSAFTLNLSGRRSARDAVANSLHAYSDTIVKKVEHSPPGPYTSEPPPPAVTVQCTSALSISEASERLKQFERRADAIHSGGQWMPSDITRASGKPKSAPKGGPLVD